MAIIVQDAFTGTNGTALTAHTPDIRPGSAAWADIRITTTADAPANDIQSNQARLGTNLTGAVIDSGVADVNVSVRWTPSASASRDDIVFRYSSNGNMLTMRARKDEGDILIQKVVANAGTTLASASFTFEAGTTYELKVICNGSTLLGFVDGVQVLNATDSAFSTATRHGIGRGTSSNLSRFDDFLITDAASVTIITPDPYQVIQRSGNQADIAITGSYVGSPSGIEARWNGGAWTAMGTVSGGNFSGTLSNQSGGQGTLEARFTNDTSVNTSVSYVGIGDIFIISGQSNACGFGTNNQSYSHATLKASLFGNDYNWKELTDPSDSNTNQVDTVSADSGTSGSVWPLLATLFMADQGVPCAFVPCAKSGSTIANWQPGVNHQDRTTLYGSMVYRALQVGAKVVLMHEGETDALNGISEALFNSQLDTIANGIGSDLGIKLMICKLQDCTGRSETNVNNAIGTAWSDNANVLAGPDFHDIVPSVDGVHWKTDGELQEAADRWWEALRDAFYTGAAGALLKQMMLHNQFSGGLF